MIPLNSSSSTITIKHDTRGPKQYRFQHQNHVSIDFEETRLLISTTKHEYNVVRRINQSSRSSSMCVEDQNRSEIVSETNEKLMFPFRNKNITRTYDTSIIAHQHRRSLQTNCVYNESDIRRAIRNASNGSSSATKIELCSKYIPINTSTTFDLYNGIGIPNKTIDFICMLGNTDERCILDAQNISQVFTIEDKSKVSFHLIDFVNSVGALFISNSSVTIKECNFFNHSGKYNGGAIEVYKSKVEIIQCNFSQNRATHQGGAVQCLSSLINMTKCNMINNTATFGGAICLEECSLTLFGHENDRNPTLFENNTGRQWGGAISTWFSNVTTIAGHFLFRYNKAISDVSVYFGGGVF
jgi:predicted outer membrane repeat protein